MYRQSKSFSIY